MKNKLTYQEKAAILDKHLKLKNIRLVLVLFLVITSFLQFKILSDSYFFTESRSVISLIICLFFILFNLSIIWGTYRLHNWVRVFFLLGIFSGDIISVIIGVAIYFAYGYLCSQVEYFAKSNILSNNISEIKK